MVPGEGIEPSLCCQNWILSPARLPIPPSRPMREAGAKTDVAGAPQRRHYRGKRPFSSNEGRAAMSERRAYRLSDFDYELPPDLIAQRPARERAREPPAARRRREARRSVLRSPARPARTGRRARRQRYSRNSGAASRTARDRRPGRAPARAHRRAGRGVDAACREPSAEAGRTHLARPWRRNRDRARTRRALRAASLRCLRRARRLSRALRRSSAAAVHRANGRARGHRALPDRLRARARRGRGADRRTALRPSDARAAARARHRPRVRSRCTSAPEPSSRWTSEDLAQHRMHRERYEIARETAAAIAAARAAGRSWLRSARPPCARSNPPRARQACARARRKPSSSSRPAIASASSIGCITNFHLPRSTLLMLVSAFGGFDTIRAAYAHAIRQRYRFFSYGDAMLLERGQRFGVESPR